MESKTATIELAVRAAFTQAKIPDELQEAVICSVDGMVRAYRARQLRPSELNGGDFTEATVKVLEFLAFGTYSALGSSIPRMDRFISNMQSANLDDTFRIHIPRHLQAIYDVRNRRGIGHLPGAISANKPDAELVLITSRWILAEFVRVLSSVADHEEAQKAVDLLSISEPAMVEDFDGILRVISKSKISIPDQVLLLLFAAKPSDMNIDQMLECVRVSRSSLAVALRRLDERNQIHQFKDGRLRLTSLGNQKAFNLCNTE